MKNLLLILCVTFVAAGCSGEATDEEIASTCERMNPTHPMYGRFCGSTGKIQYK